METQTNQSSQLHGHGLWLEALSRGIAAHPGSKTTRPHVHCSSQETAHVSDIPQLGLHDKVACTDLNFYLSLP